MKHTTHLRRLWKLTRVMLIIGIAMITAGGIYFHFAVQVHPPEVSLPSGLPRDRTRIGENAWSYGNNWLRRNTHGLWELYVEGGPYERGHANGILTRELIYRQEKAFTDQIQVLVPNRIYRSALWMFVTWFNRHLDESTPEEYRREIFGVSEHASKEFQHIAGNYERILNYHAAHDIGHALSGMHLVGCTSFAVWDSSSADGSLLVGRNFDFSVGDEFAKEKIVCLVNPTSGHRFMMITWGGMIGAVSGMNARGLTVTINAAKSDKPLESATPISIIAREILQYAGTIREAFAIAAKRRAFVSESIMIGSLQDKRTAIIEKSPSRTTLYDPKGTSISCSNHFQSRDFKRTESPADTGIRNESPYRFQRVEELMNRYPRLSVMHAAAILRDRFGLSDRDIGMGNPKSINQLIAHHSIIFQPARNIVWVSTRPYQLGAYVAYDLSDFFSASSLRDPAVGITTERLNIPPDPFLASPDYRRFRQFTQLRRAVEHAVSGDGTARLDAEQIAAFTACNPEFYRTHSLLGAYYESIGDIASALRSYERAAEKEIPSPAEADAIAQHVHDCRARLGLRGGARK